MAAPSKRAMTLDLIKIAGYHNDSKAFTRLLIDGPARVSRAAAEEAWAKGIKARDAGMRCGCRECKLNPAPAFGSRERTRAYGNRKGGHGSGARADRRRKRQAGRKATGRAQELVERMVKLQAEGKRLTKTQVRALERAESRLQAEGGIPDDAHLQELAKAHQERERAIEAVLGRNRQTHAVKVALEDRPMNRPDLEALQTAGWALRAAGTVPAKVGKTLAALNPSDALDRLLGPRGEVRAVVIQSSAPFGEDLVRALQADGFDVSPAPRDLRDTPARVRNQAPTSQVAINPRQRATGAATGRHLNPEDGSMRKTTTGRKKAATTSRKRAEKAQASATSRAKKPARPTSRTAVKPTRAPKSGASTKGAAKRKPGRAALALNPSDAQGLAKVWKAWTGSEPGQSFRINVEEPARYGLPSRVVLLGRVAWFATKGGEEKRFGDSGPYMVTDAKAEKVWLVSHKAQRFDMEPALIGYHMRKPKFGDRETVEYVHAFEGRTHAVMDGQVGAFTGTFRITPDGLEG